LVHGPGGSVLAKNAFDWIRNEGWFPFLQFVRRVFDIYAKSANEDLEFN